MQTDCDWQPLLNNIHLFEIMDMSELESIRIGECSLSMSHLSLSLFYGGDHSGKCRIQNCPRLKSILVGDSSFTDCVVFERACLPSLESIDIGDKCFVHVPLFTLSGSR